MVNKPIVKTASIAGSEVAYSQGLPRLKLLGLQTFGRRTSYSQKVINHQLQQSNFSSIIRSKFVSKSRLELQKLGLVSSQADRTLELAAVLQQSNLRTERELKNILKDILD